MKEFVLSDFKLSLFGVNVNDYTNLYICFFGTVVITKSIVKRAALLRICLRKN